MRPIHVCALAFASLWLGACTSQYYDLAYEPSPVEAAVKWDNAPSAQGRALISVVGVRKPDKSTETPAGVEVRMRFENLGSEPLTVDTEGISLLSADLKQFGKPALGGAPNPEVPPEGDTTLDFYFPFPDGKGRDDVDMEGLNLRWSVSHEGQVVTSGVTFVRSVRSYYDEPRTSFSFGVGYVGH